MLGRKSLAILVVFCALGGAVQAATYDCTFKASKKGGYIVSPVRLTVDEAKGTATAYDSHTQAKHGGAVPARFTRRSSSSVQFDWEVEVLYKRNRTSQADFRVTLNLSNMRAKIRAHVPGDFEESTGSGKCRKTG